MIELFTLPFHTLMLANRISINIAPVSLLFPLLAKAILANVRIVVVSFILFFLKSVFCFELVS